LIAFFSTVGFSALQGMLRFVSYAVVNAFSGIIRVVFAVIAIILGFNAPGVVWSLLATSIVTFGVSLYALRDILNNNAKKQVLKRKSLHTTLWVTAAFLGMGLMINVDVLLVKHFFSSYDAGLYAALSTIGKIVLFLSSSIATVFLPVATNKKESGKSAHKEFMAAMIIVLVLSLSVLLVYKFIPQLVISLLYGSEYQSIEGYLWMIGTYFLFYNISFLFINYFISFKQHTILVAPLIMSCIQVLLLFIFHESFNQILHILIGTAMVLSLIFTIYYIRNETKK
jgi:O-antigen/teichoic acid export membrane protein